MINWTKYFDRIYCIHFVQFDNRKKLMQTELKRVGILDSGIFEWHLTFDTGLDKRFNKYVKYSNIITNDQGAILNVSINLGHYHCIRDAYHEGYEHILIVEDDQRFLKDLNKIEQILDNTPENWNIILYDKMAKGGRFRKQFKSVNNYYDTFYCLFSAGCYALDRRGMERMIHLLQTVLLNIDGFFYESSHFLNGLNYYCSKTNIAVQGTFKNSYTINDVLNLNNPLKWQQSYTCFNIKFDDYMMKQGGAVYYYGDWIDSQIEQQQNQNKELILTEDKKQITNTSILPTQINIFLAININQIDKSYLLLYSLLKYSKSKFNVYIMLNKENVEEYYQLFKPFEEERLKIILLDNKLLEDKEIIYAKMLIPTLFSNLDRILYLNYNTVVVKQGIEWFYNLNFDDNYLAVVEEKQYLHINDIKRKTESDIFEEINDRYFNADVMLWNITKFNKEYRDIIKQSQDSNINKINFQFNSQSLLNWLLNKEVLWCNNIFNSNEINMFTPTLLDIKFLKNNWNFKNLQEFIDNIIVANYNGQDKPWDDHYKKGFYLSKGQEQLHEKYKTLQREVVRKLNEYYMV